jgi:hypothetical protein
VRLVVRGAPPETVDHTGRFPAATGGRVELSPGDDYGKAAAELKARGWEGAFVVHVRSAKPADPFPRRPFPVHCFAPLCAVVLLKASWPAAISSLAPPCAHKYPSPSTPTQHMA